MKDRAGICEKTHYDALETAEQFWKVIPIVADEKDAWATKCKKVTLEGLCVPALARKAKLLRGPVWQN